LRMTLPVAGTAAAAMALEARGEGNAPISTRSVLNSLVK